MRGRRVTTTQPSDEPTALATSKAIPAIKAGWARTAYSPVNSGLRFSNIALMPSPRSFDGRNAEFHAAT